MLANVFPIPDLPLVNSTSVCHYFAKEWVKMGHEVVVIYNYTIYTPILHTVAALSEYRIANYWSTVINKKRFDKTYEYEVDGIKVFLIPCYKFIPKVSFPKCSIEKQIKTIYDCMRSINFHPDVVVGHFLHPSLEIVSQLKLLYKVKTAMVLHGKIQINRDIDAINKHKENIDIWGFRSNPIKKSFEQYWSREANDGFMCFSGVPAEYITLDAYNKMTDNLQRFVYVGNLISRKHPLTVVEAIHKVYKQNSFSLVYVGSGCEESYIKSYISTRRIEQHVKLLGRQKREEVKRRVLNAECFIMVSKSETFGLVYLEAMANGCITVASKNEGMEGIIKDGYNGFLCRAGDVDELVAKIEHIRGLSKEERISISKNAIQTAQSMTDAKVANEYLNSLLKL